MIKRILMSMLILVAIVAFVGFAFYQVHAFRETAKAQKNREFSDRVVRDLHDALRRKATKSECQEILNAHGVFWYVDKGMSGSESIQLKPGIWRIEIKDTSWSMLYRGNTYIALDFDDKDALVNVVVKDTFIGI